MSDELVPQYLRAFDGTFQSANPCTRVRGNGFSQDSNYEAPALDTEDCFALLSEIKGNTGEYEVALLVATCGLRISEALGLKWRDIWWDKEAIAIRQTFVYTLQEGAQTKLSRSKVEVPRFHRCARLATADLFTFVCLELRPSTAHFGPNQIPNSACPECASTELLVPLPLPHKIQNPDQRNF